MFMMGKGRRKKGWFGWVDDMSPYFKSRITNALALRLMNADWTAVDMFRPPILVIASKTNYPSTSKK